MRLINALDSYFFIGDDPTFSDRMWFYGGTALMVLIGLATFVL